MMHHSVCHAPHQHTMTSHSLEHSQAALLWLYWRSDGLMFGVIDQQSSMTKLSEHLLVSELHHPNFKNYFSDLNRSFRKSRHHKCRISINKKDTMGMNSVSALMLLANKKNRCLQLCLVPSGVHLPSHPPEIDLASWEQMLVEGYRISHCCIVCLTYFPLLYRVRLTLRI